MTDARAVFSLFSERYGIQENEDDVKAFCFTALREIGALLREGAAEDDIRVLGAAAALANYRLKMREFYAGESITSFRAGDIAVSSDPSCAAVAAKSEYLQALEALTPLLEDAGFLFRQVII